MKILSFGIDCNAFAAENEVCSGIGHRKFLSGPFSLFLISLKIFEESNGDIN